MAVLSIVIKNLSFRGKPVFDICGFGHVLKPL